MATKKKGKGVAKADQRVFGRMFEEVRQCALDGARNGTGPDMDTLLDQLTCEIDGKGVLTPENLTRYAQAKYGDALQAHIAGLGLEALVRDVYAKAEKEIDRAHDAFLREADRADREYEREHRNDPPPPPKLVVVR